MSILRTTAWFAWGIASIFYAYQYILRVMPSIMMNDIMNQFNMDSAVFGQFSGVYYIGYSLFHLPIGIMLDRVGPRKIMSGSILLTAAGLLPIIFAQSSSYAIIGRVLMGIGSSAAILGTFKIIRITFREQHFTRMLSLSVTIGLIGAIYGGGPVNELLKQISYTNVVKVFAVLGIILAIITYIIVPEIEKNEHGTVISEIKIVLTNSKVLAVCFFAGLMVGPLEGFADVWGSEFLKQVYGFEDSVASYLPSMIFIGMCFGAPLLSVIAEKTNSYLGAIIGAGAVMLATFAALVTGWLTITTMILSFVMVGIASAYQIIAIYKASTYVQDNVAGLTTAVANMIIMIFGYAFHSIIGYIIEAYSAEGEATSYTYGISVVPIALAIGVIGFAILALIDSERKAVL